MFTVTESAALVIKAQMESEGEGEMFLRVFIRPGAGGMQFGMSSEENSARTTKSASSAASKCSWTGSVRARLTGWSWDIRRQADLASASPRTMPQILNEADKHRYSMHFPFAEPLADDMTFQTGCV